MLNNYKLLFTIQGRPCYGKWNPLKRRYDVKKVTEEEVYVGKVTIEVGQLIHYRKNAAGIIPSAHTKIGVLKAIDPPVYNLTDDWVAKIRIHKFIPFSFKFPLKFEKSTFLPNGQL